MSSGSKLPYLHSSFDLGKGEDNKSLPPARELAKLVHIPKKPPIVKNEDKQTKLQKQFFPRTQVPELLFSNQKIVETDRERVDGYIVSK